MKRVWFWWATIIVAVLLAIAWPARLAHVVPTFTAGMKMNLSRSPPPSLVRHLRTGLAS
jgi:hypothetical protein